MAILEIKDVSKSFNGKKVLDSLTFSVPEGSIFGFVGKNGAGKTTTMKMILGLETVDQGEIKLLGEAVRFGENRTNRHTGYLPDVPEFYGYMKAKEYLMLCAEITGIDKIQRKKRVDELLELVNLQENKTAISGFSRGMKQRLGIAQALLNKPKLLICDEPTSALDPNGRRELLDLLDSLRKETTVVFSTHILNDVEQICDYIGILDQGKMVTTASIKELKQKYKKKQVQIAFETIEDKQLFLNKWTHESVEIEEEQLLVSFQLNDKTSARVVFELLATLAIVPLSFKQKEPSLEDIYLEVIA
ncbi:ATP-binding cassette domain-containing protein [Enterococcus olivae]